MNNAIWRLIMKFIELETLSLYIIDRQNKEDLEFVKKLFHDENIKKWVNGISNILSEDRNRDFFGSGFIVKNVDEYIGYVGIGNFNKEEKCVYLRAGISKDKTGHGYGKRLLNEITEYMFSNFSDLESIRLKINSENIPSLMTANSCGYRFLYGDFYVKYSSKVKTK